MAILKSKEIAKMNQNEINEKMKDLKIELVKARITLSKAGKTNLREIKKTIAKLMTFKNKLKKTQIKPIKEAKNKKQ